MLCSRNLDYSSPLPFHAADSPCRIVRLTSLLNCGWRYRLEPGAGHTKAAISRTRRPGAPRIVETGVIIKGVVALDHHYPDPATLHMRFQVTNVGAPLVIDGVTSDLGSFRREVALWGDMYTYRRSQCQP